MLGPGISAWNLQNLNEEPEIENLVGMWGPMSGIWNLGPGITPYAGEPVWTLQNLITRFCGGGVCNDKNEPIDNRISGIFLKDYMNLN